MNPLARPRSACAPTIPGQPSHRPSSPRRGLTFIVTSAASRSPSVISHPSPGPTDPPGGLGGGDTAAPPAGPSPPTVAQTTDTGPPGPRLNVTVPPPVSTPPQSTDGCDSITRRTACGSSNPAASAAAKRSTPV